MANYVILGTYNGIWTRRTFICFTVLVDRGTFSQSNNSSAKVHSMTSRRSKLSFLWDGPKVWTCSSLTYQISQAKGSLKQVCFCRVLTLTKARNEYCIVKILMIGLQEQFPIPISFFRGNGRVPLQVNSKLICVTYSYIQCILIN